MASTSNNNNSNCAKTTKQTYKSQTIDYKRTILLELQDGTSASVIAKREGLARSTISTWLKNKEKILASCSESGGAKNEVRKRKKEPSRKHVDEALYTWFTQVRSENVPINGPILLAKANKFADDMHADHVTRGWVDRWKVRHGIGHQRIQGESGSVNMEVVSNWKEEKLKPILEEYDESDIYNMDETGLFYKMSPSSTLHFKGQKCEGGKQCKERLTLALAANMNGTDKLPVLVIGKSAKPRCFKNVATLPVQYEFNRKA